MRVKGVLNKSTMERYEAAKQKQFIEGKPSIIKYLEDKKNTPCSSDTLKNILRGILREMNKESMSKFIESNGFIPPTGKNYATAGIGDAIEFFYGLSTEYLKEREKGGATKKREPVKTKEKEVDPIETPSVEIMDEVDIPTKYEKKSYVSPSSTCVSTQDILANTILSKLTLIEVICARIYASFLLETGKLKESVTSVKIEHTENRDELRNKLKNKYDVSNFIKEGTHVKEFISLVGLITLKDSLMSFIPEVFRIKSEEVINDFKKFNLEEIKEILIPTV